VRGTCPWTCNIFLVGFLSTDPAAGPLPTDITDLDRTPSPSNYPP
jgi:hypothetical protein